MPNLFHTMFVSCTSFRWNKTQQWEVHLQNWKLKLYNCKAEKKQENIVLCNLQLVKWKIPCFKPLYKWCWTIQQTVQSLSSRIFYSHDTKQKFISLILSAGSFPNFWSRFSEQPSLLFYSLYSITVLVFHTKLKFWL